MTDLVNQQSNVAGQTVPIAVKKPIGEFKVHTMPDKFLHYLNKSGMSAVGAVAGKNKIGGSKRGLIIAIAVAVMIVLVLGAAAWLFVKSINQKPAENNVAVNQEQNNNQQQNQQQENQETENQEQAETGQECLMETCTGCNAEQCRILSNVCQLENISEPDPLTGEIKSVEKCVLIVKEEIPAENATSTPEDPAEGSGQVAATDTDNDGLTDAEERVWGTDEAAADTDGDGYADSLEIGNLYDPLKGDSARLAANNKLAKTWNNSQNGFSVLYPSIFSAVAKEDGDGVIFTEATSSQFFQVSILDNEDNAEDIDEWYLAMNPTTQVDEIQHLTVGGKQGIVADNSSIYVLNGAKVYLINYNMGYPPTAYFFTSFNALVKSFQFFNNPMPLVNE
jgi:hypothetical protein